MNTHVLRLGALGSALALAMSLTMSACGDDASSSVADGKVTLSIPPVGDSLPVYRAISEGYFHDEGLDIELTPAANGATTINALVSGSTDLALVSYPSLITARSSNLPVTIAAPAIAGTKEYQAGLYVLDGSAIQEPKDMLGKRFATPSLGSVGDIWFRGVLHETGLDYNDVEYVEIPQANMASALKAGDVDGIFQTEPTLSATRANLNIRPIDYQVGPQGLFATSNKVLEDNPDVVTSFRAALARAVKDINADPHGVAETEMPKYTDMSAKTARAMALPDFQVKYDAAGVQEVIDLMVTVGLLDKGYEATDLFVEMP